MFCDLVDGIAAKLDAEEWRDLVALTEQQLIVQAISNPNITARGHPLPMRPRNFSLKGNLLFPDNPLHRSRKVSCR